MIDTGTLVTIGSFISVQVGGLIWTLATSKGEARALRQELAHMQKELERFGTVLEQLADMKGEFRLAAERSLAQGKRLDELSSRFDRRFDEQR